MYKAERDKFTVYNFQFNNEHIPEHVQSWKVKRLNGYFNEINTNCDS